MLTLITYLAEVVLVSFLYCEVIPLLAHFSVLYLSEGSLTYLDVIGLKAQGSIC